MNIEWPDMDDFDDAAVLVGQFLLKVGTVLGALILLGLIALMFVSAWPISGWIALTIATIVGTIWVVALVRRNRHARINNRSESAETD